MMMRIRIPNGVTNAKQLRVIGEIGEEFGKGFVDITTRQQIQLRWYTINQVPEIWRRLEEVGLGPSRRVWTTSGTLWAALWRALQTMN